MKNTDRVIWGIILVAIGVIFALNAFGITNINVFFNGWWTLFIIIPCFAGLFTERQKTGNLIGLLIGVFLLLCCRGILDFGLLWKLVIPVIIVIIGLKMIFGVSFGNKSRQILKDLETDGKELKNGYAAFSGKTLCFDGEVFNGAELTAVFGGVKCDLTKAIFEKDSVINASATFGGIDIILPDNVNIKVNSNSLFGGVSDKKHRNVTENPFTVYINATCMFGGVDIK